MHLQGDNQQFEEIIDKSSERELEVGAGGIFMSCDVTSSLRLFGDLDIVASAWSHVSSRNIDFIKVQIPNYGCTLSFKIKPDGACGLRVLHCILEWEAQWRSGKRVSWDEFSRNPPKIESRDLYAAVIKLCSRQIPLNLRTTMKKFDREVFPRSVWMSDVLLNDMLRSQDVPATIWICPKGDDQKCSLRLHNGKAIKIALDDLR